MISLKVLGVTVLTDTENWGLQIRVSKAGNCYRNKLLPFAESSRELKGQGMLEPGTDTAKVFCSLSH